MVRSAAGKVMWVGRATVFLVGLSVILALVFGAASMALAGTGVGDTFNLGRLNTVNQLSRLVGSTDNAMLRIDNNSAGTNATALDLQVEPGHAPLKVDSLTRVSNLNVDFVDGHSASSFVASFTYREEDPPTTGTAFGGNTRLVNESCDPGDRLLTGGPANIDEGTIVLESFPADTNTWRVRIQNDATLDEFNVVVLCANQ